MVLVEIKLHEEEAPSEAIDLHSGRLPSKPTMEEQGSHLSEEGAEAVVGARTPFSKRLLDGGSEIFIPSETYPHEEEAPELRRVHSGTLCTLSPSPLSSEENEGPVMEMGASTAFSRRLSEEDREAICERRVDEDRVLSLSGGRVPEYKGTDRLKGHGGGVVAAVGEAMRPV
eukprot:RCo016065